MKDDITLFKTRLKDASHMMDCGGGGGWEEWNGKLGVDSIGRGFHFPQYFLFFTLFAKSWVCI